MATEQCNKDRSGLKLCISICAFWVVFPLSVSKQTVLTHVFSLGKVAQQLLRGKEEAKHFSNTVVCRFVSVIRVEPSRPIGVVLTHLDCLSELSDRRRCVQTGSCFTFGCGQKFREMQLTDERGYVRSQNVLLPL